MEEPPTNAHDGGGFQRDECSNDRDGCDGNMQSANSSIFQFHPILHSKKVSGKGSKNTTPRNLVFPEATDIQSGQHELPMAAPVNHQLHHHHQHHQRHHHSSHHHRVTKHESQAAKKYTPSSTDIADTPSVIQPSASSLSRRRTTIRDKLSFVARRTRHMSRQTLRSTKQLYSHLSLQQVIAYVLLIFGMLSEATTPSPRYNVPIGVVIFVFSTSEIAHHTVVVTGLCLTILTDFVWLLRPQEGSFNASFLSTYDSVAHFSLAVCAMAKLWLIFSTYFVLESVEEDEVQEGVDVSPGQERERQRRQTQSWLQTHRHWDHIKYLFPRKTIPRRSHLSFEVLMRSIALVWIHGVCGLVLLLLGGLSALLYSNKTQFRSTTFGIPLHLMLIFRASTVLANYVVATQDMNYYGCLKLSGCHKLAEFDEGSSGEIVLKYNAKWLQKLKRAKAVDAIAGVYLMFVLYAAFHSSQYFIASGVVAILVVIVLVILVLDLWTPLLILVIARCGAMLHYHHRRGTVDVDPYFPNQLEWEEEDGENSSSSDSESESAQSSGETSSQEDSPSYSSSSDEYSSAIDYGSDDPHNHRLRHRQSSHRRRTGKSNRRKLEQQTLSRRGSRKPLISHTPSFRRQASLPIVDAHEVAASPHPIITSNRDGMTANSMWIRYWDDQDRSYLVHSVTGESVWEMVPHARPKASGSSMPLVQDAVAQPQSNENSSSSAFSPYFSHLQNHLQKEEPSTIDSDVIVASVTTTRAISKLSSRQQSSRAVEKIPSTEMQQQSQMLSPDEFLAFWGTMVDAGSFICRVSRIPNSQDISRHLLRQGFSVAFDGLNSDDMRVVHFYAAIHQVNSNSLPPTAEFFLGEFIFDSLSLRLHAKFRCPQADAVVTFVKKLQLKGIVGSYVPCE